jgi:hypothetical protein
MVYAKVHTCGFDTEAFLTPGHDFHVCELDAATGASEESRSFLTRTAASSSTTRLGQFGHAGRKGRVGEVRLVPKLGCEEG